MHKHTSEASEQEPGLAYTVIAVGESAWQEHLPSLEAARRAAEAARDEGARNLILVEESTRTVVFHQFDQRAPEDKDYSVRLAGMLVWEEHLPSLEQAERSAEEPRAMGLQDVQIVDEATGEVVE